MPAIKIPAVDSLQNTAALKSAGRQEKTVEGLQAAFSKYMSQSSANVAVGRQAMTESAPKSQDASVKDSYSQYQGKAEAKAGAVKAQDAKKAPADASVAEGAVQDVESQVKELLEKELGVDEGQIEEAMEALGLTVLDLLNPGKLAELTVELTGSKDIGAVLFDENFQALLQGVSEITENMLQKLGMTMEELTDQIQSQLQNQTQMQTQPLEQMTAQQTQVTAEEALTQSAPENALELEGLEETQQKEQQTAVASQDAVAKETAGAEEKTEAMQDASLTEQGEKLSSETVQKVESDEGEKQPKQQLQDQDAQAQSKNAQQSLEQDLDPENSLGSKDKEQFGFKPEEENGHFEFTHHTDRADAAPTQNITNQAPMPQADVRDVIQQIVEYTKVSLTQQVKTIEMQLNPENLGKVFLHISEKQGIVTAQITAQNENIKEALIQQAAELKDNLNQQGVKVEAVEVSVGTHEFEKNLEKDARQQKEQERQQEEQRTANSRRSINLNDLNELGGLSGLMSEEEALVAQIMRDNGNKVDFKA